MSAYMVDRNHVAYLIDAAMHLRIVKRHDAMRWLHDGKSHFLYTSDHKRASEIGQMLWDANAESIRARYPDTREDFSNAPGPIGERFIYGEHRGGRWYDVNPAQVIESCRCFAYQACEYEGWQGSEAHAFIESLKRHATDSLCVEWEQDRPGRKLVWGAPEPISATPGLALTR